MAVSYDYQGPFITLDNALDYRSRRADPSLENYVAGRQSLPQPTRDGVDARAADRRAAGAVSKAQA